MPRGRPKGSVNKSKESKVSFSQTSPVEVKTEKAQEAIKAHAPIKNEIPPMEKVPSGKRCVNCEDNCEGNGLEKWHYGSPDRWCNKCKCVAYLS